MAACPSCGSLVSPGTRFCPECGSPQGRSCERCGTANPSTSRFCANCGAALLATEIAEERKLVTILFADVTGSTALGERLDPERLRSLLRGYFDAMSEVITSWGGRLEKFIGHANMAPFG